MRKNASRAWEKELLNLAPLPWAGSLLGGAERIREALEVVDLFRSGWEWRS
jgi:hypothetical protein